jgi:hypothetical protein
MPLTSSQLAALVDRAKQKSPPVVSPPPPLRIAQHSVPPRRPVAPLQAASARPPPSPARPPPTAPVKSTLRLRTASTPAAAVVPAAPAPAPQPEPTVEPDAFPIGWVLGQDSWRFHRRFFAIFKRPMGWGEYGFLLKQIRSGQAEHLGADGWRVTLPSGRTLPVRCGSWSLITVLPKNWQPPPPAPGCQTGLEQAATSPDLR